MSIILCRFVTGWVRQTSFLSSKERGTLGPIFFHGTLNTARYLEISNEFVDQLDDDELRNGYFQQDGATCHTSKESMAEIESFFDDRVI